jgi:CheY-like chemotaxis protein
MKSTTQYTILFADDEPWLSEALRLSLESRQYECISTTNASEAWQVLEERSVDVVVTDIMMPGGDLFADVDSAEAGFHFVRKLRQQYPRLPIICLSVIGDTEKIEGLKRQNILYLRKGETPLDTALKLIVSKATGRMSFD